MRTVLLRFFAVFSIFVALGSISGNDKARAQQVRVSMQVFYDELAPYGDWIYDRAFGYVWVPDARDFHPYHTNGYWEMTIYGNTWVSLYPWGWAPFHYGRWTYDPYYGWIWIPGFEWAPAWVCWRYGGGLYGWAPLGPQFVVTISFGTYTCPHNWWIFTPHHYLYGPRHRSHYRVNDDERYLRNTAIVQHTTIDRRSGTRFPTGPTEDDIRNATGRPAEVKDIRDLSSPAAGNADDKVIPIYRPDIDREGVDNTSPRQYQQAERAIVPQQPVPTDRRPVDRPADRYNDRREPIDRAPQQPVRREPIRPTPVQEPVRQPRIDRPKEQPRTEPVRTLPPTRQAEPRREAPIRQPQNPAPEKQRASPGSIRR